MKIKYQSQFDLLRELVIVGIIFVAICFGISSLQHDLELKRVHKLIESEKQSKIEIMKIALENNRLNQDYILLLQESREQLNTAVGNQNLELEEYRYLEKLKKDLSRH